MAKCADTNSKLAGGCGYGDSVDSSLLPYEPDGRITLVGVPQTLPVYLHYPEIEQLIEFDYKGKHIGFAGLFHTRDSVKKTAI